MNTFSIFLILIVIVAFLLVLVIMVQNPKGGGLASSFGGGGVQQLGGVKQTTDFLDKSTWALAILLLALILLSNFAIENSNEKDEEFILKIGQPLEFDKNDSYPFIEWLNLTKISPIDRTNHSNQRQQKNINIIDSFIDKKPRIAKLESPKSLENLAEKSILKPDDLMTETLARIYLEQKNYDKAIKSFKILSLKYPEKSSLFANQIKAIMKLQEK